MIDITVVEETKTDEEFKDVAIGALIISAIIIIVMVIGTVVSESDDWSLVVLVPICYFIAILFLYGYLAFSRSQLEQNETMFMVKPPINRII